MLRIVGSTLSLVGSGRRSIMPATNGSQRVSGCNPVFICSPTVTCSPKTEAKVTVICSPKTEAKVAKKFKRKSSIPIQICLSKNDNIPIHQYIEMSQDLNPSACSSLVIFMYCACENCTFNTTPTERLQQHPDMGRLQHKCNRLRLLAPCSIAITNKQHHNVIDHDYFVNNHDYNRNYVCLQTSSERK